MSEKNFPVELGKVVFGSGRNVQEGLPRNDWENNNTWSVMFIWNRQNFKLEVAKILGYNII